MLRVSGRHMARKRWRPATCAATTGAGIKEDRETTLPLSHGEPKLSFLPLRRRASARTT